MAKDIENIGTGERGLFSFDKSTGKLKKIREAKKLPAAPYVHTDTMEPIESMATHTRQVFDSKSAYRQHLKDHGFVETGGKHLLDSLSLRPDEEAYQRQMKEDIEKSYYDVKYDRVEFSEAEREQHLREERKWKSENANWKVKAPS